MRFLKRTTSTLWKHLSLPFWLLFTCLAALILLAQLQLPRAITATADWAERASQEEHFRLAAAAIQSSDRERIERAKDLRRSLAEVEALLAIAGESTGGAPASEGIRQMRYATAQVGISSALLLAGDAPRNEAAARKGAAAQFRAELGFYRERAALGRERAIADDLEGRFANLLATTESFQAFGAAAQELRAELAALSTDPTVIATAPVASMLSWMRWLVTVLGGAGIVCGAVALAEAGRRVTRPATHLLEVARAITHGVKRRASPDRAGDLAPLAEAFNQMVDARQLAEDRLQADHDSLEMKVSSRTAELWRANKTLREESEQRVRAERDFHQAQKMDALGKLAGSIAHDFNNLLTVIIGGAECVRKRLGANHVCAPMLNTVEQAGTRAAALTRPLLTFSRNEILAVEALSLNDAAHEAAQMLYRLLGVNVELRLDFAGDLKPVKANATQIQQVLINLGVNARDAMGGMGILTFVTRNTTVERAITEPMRIPAADSWVELVVSDTGSGMDAATKARIFEPFFTTKPAGRGTGLGLATVFGIIKQMGGFLEVESTVGEGTTFHVFLPATTPAPAAVAPAPAKPEAPAEPTGAETLLLVDDEDDIRELVQITLEGCGYHVLSAPNAEEAIVLGEKHAGEIRALITDVTMPGMTGVQLAGVMIRLIPDLKVLFVSGHSNETISDETLLTTNADYLQKPFFGDALANKVRQVLSPGNQRRLTPVAEVASVGWAA